MWKFRGIELLSDERVMEPRSDILVEVGLLEPYGSRVHDLGTGSGAVAIALILERRDLIVSASDISSHAVDLTKKNIKKFQLEIQVSKFDGMPEGVVDLILANLPYLTSREASAQGLVGKGWGVVERDDPLVVIRKVRNSIPQGQRIAFQHPKRLIKEVAALFENPTLLFSDRDPCVTLGVA
jgi:release factor glutamine methyltransferase